MTMVLRRFTLLFANGWQRRRDPLWRPRRGGDEDDEQHDGDCDGDDDDDDGDDIDNADDAMFPCRILYGGSVTAANCRELAACKDIDGNALL